MRANQLIDGFGSRQVVADRANSTQALYGYRHFPVGSPLDEFLETTELNDMQARLADVVIAIGQQRDLAVSFNPAQWIDSDSAESLGVGSRL